MLEPLPKNSIVSLETSEKVRYACAVDGRSGTGKSSQSCRPSCAMTDCNKDDRHQALIDVSRYADDVEVGSFRSRMKCGSKHVDVRPNRKEHPAVTAEVEVSVICTPFLPVLTLAWQRTGGSAIEKSRYREI